MLGNRHSVKDKIYPSLKTLNSRQSSINFSEILKLRIIETKSRLTSQNPTNENEAISNRLMSNRQSQRQQHDEVIIRDVPKRESYHLASSLTPRIIDGVVNYQQE